MYSLQMLTTENLLICVLSRLDLTIKMSERFILQKLRVLCRDCRRHLSILAKTQTGFSVRVKLGRFSSMLTATPQLKIVCMTAIRFWFRLTVQPMAIRGHN